MAINGNSVTFVAAERTCSSTASFLFTRPEGYRFDPGQYMSLTLKTREGEQTKQFSHGDAPGDAETRILTRLTGSAFKEALLALRPGDEVDVRGPFGRLTVPPGVTRAAFLVGGVGIGPARCIVRDAAQRGTGLTALVFDGNMDETCVPFREEFDAYERDDARVRFVHVLEKPSESWTGERGLITAELVRRYCDPAEGWHWFVTGPPAMVTAMRAVLKDLGVPAARSSFELFAGYR
jgi:ferredoxin-NADP reductase